MVDLRNLTSVFEIGFAIHFAFPFFEELRQRAITRQVLRIKELDEAAGAEMAAWATFRTQVSYAHHSLRSLTLFCSWIAFVVAIFSLGLLIYVGFSANESVIVSDSAAGALVAITLIPLALLASAIEKRSRYLERYLEEHHKFFAWITAMYGPGSLVKAEGDVENTA